MTRPPRHRTTTLAIAAICALTAGLIAAPPSSAHRRPSISTVISGLNTPRGLTFDNRGNLYVAESGVAGTGSAGLTHTGRVSKYRWGSTTPTWSTGFESLYASEDPTQPPDVLGPEGISAACPDNYGRDGVRAHHEDHGRRGQCSVQMIMSESHKGIAATTGGAVQTKDAGHLYQLDTHSGTPTDLSNVGDQSYRWTREHKYLFPSDFPDANPYGVLVTNSRHRGYDGYGRDHRHHRSGDTRTFVVDAGANTVSEIGRHGRQRVISYIPNETSAPFRDSTPTCATLGPDGMLYVATLDLVANFATPGRSHVYRVDPNANFPTVPTLWASGLTTATACTFDRQGNFWATEMFQPTSGPPGDVVRIPFDHPTHITHLGGGKLPLPGGITQGPDGAMYVTVNSASPDPGSGAVMRIEAHRHHG